METDVGEYNTKEMQEIIAVAGFAAALRREICERNREFARTRGLAHQFSYGGAAVVVYEGCEAGHGNFHPAAWRAIAQNRSWSRRLAKVHTAGRTALPRREQGRWRELDSCTSSDALLMNVFCHPAIWRDGRLAAMLGVEDSAPVEFGVRARVPLADGGQDRTEVDARIGTLLIEAKLTESGFQSCS